MSRRHKRTASRTAGPAEASGTFNSLCKVLCSLRSLYLCSIGPTALLLLARTTPRLGHSNCSLKRFYSQDMNSDAPIDRPEAHFTRTGALALVRDPFQGIFLTPSQPDTPVHSYHSPQHRNHTPSEAGKSSSIVGRPTATTITRNNSTTTTMAREKKESSSVFLSFVRTRPHCRRNSPQHGYVFTITPGRCRC